MTEYEPGTPSWVDLGTPEVDRAANFYSELFGWRVEEGPPEAGGYRMAVLRERPVAGLGPQMNPDAPPWWTTYVTVGDADATASAVRGAGGAVIVEPFDVLDVGRMAIFTDTVGATFAVWQPMAHKGAGLVNEPGTLCWNELATRDVDAAKSFYTAALGWDFRTMDMDGAAYTIVTTNGRDVAGMMAMDDSIPPEVPSHWMVYFAVADCDATAAKVADLGGTVSVPPTDIPVGRFAVCNDPAGALFSILQLAPA